MEKELVYITVALTQENADKAIELAGDQPEAISKGVNIALEQA